jgi:ubiquinone/menaquinone biosynthesis C-methylase UbiE
VSTTINERLRQRSKRFPYRLALDAVPLHTLAELRFESRLAWLRLTRRGIDPRFAASKDLLVNVGCGAGGREGWVNIDCFPAQGVTCVRDCRTALPLPSASAQGIFTEHFFEHLDYYEEAPKFLQECKRVLGEGGTLRVIVPDGAKYLATYCTGDLADMAAFSPVVTMDPADDEAPFSIERAVLPFRTKMEIVNFHFRQSGQHRFSYDFETLSGLLQECGFTSITEMPFGKSNLADLAIDSELRAAESLVIEAVAPADDRFPAEAAAGEGHASGAEVMRKAWEARAESDPLYAIDARRRTWELGDFYAQGPLLVADIVDPALERLSVNPSGRRVLEIGCGMGRLFEGLSARFSEIVGIDISEGMISKGRAECPVEATWLVGDGMSLAGVESDSIDHALSYEVFEHIPHPSIIETYFSEIMRVLRPGGTFQAQLRGNSDSTRQAIVRGLPRPLRVASGVVLRSMDLLPVRGDIDTWLGCIVPPADALRMLARLGFVDNAAFNADFAAGPDRSLSTYWVIGRKPMGATD